MAEGKRDLIARVEREAFGTLTGGEPVEAITLTNAAGMRACIITYGAGIQAVMVPDRNGVMADVALGHADLQPYIEQPQYIGSTVGRVANRIARGRFTLDGRTYQTPVNNGPNALHGGTKGFDKVVWRVVNVQRGPAASVTLAVSPSSIVRTVQFTLSKPRSPPCSELGPLFTGTR